MKHAKKLASMLLALVMMLALGTTAFAQEETVTGSGKATITITNAAKDATYKVYKLFDATVTGTDGGSISYTGTVPASLTAYFEADAAGNITVKDAAYKDATTKTEMSDGLRAALKEWAKTATPTATAISDGTELQFKGLPYGYYVVTTSQGEQAITVTSTNPNATIHDKNEVFPKELTKDVDKTDVNIGDKVTYTVTFKTANFTNKDGKVQKITSHIIDDTLPDFLSNVHVENITVNDGTDHDVTAQFDEHKQITLKWYNKDNNTFLYNNGATVTIKYTAVVADKAAIDGNGNTNKVTLRYTVDDKTTPEPDKLEKDKTIYTYAIALKKVDEKGKPLAGAKFELPFYVKKNADGTYIYAGKKPGEDLTNTVISPENGEIVIKGVASGTYEITESEAPAGYNKLTAPFTVTAKKLSQTSTHTTTYLDKDGNITKTETETKVDVNLDKIAATVHVIVNKTGSMLPSTGGMGTTMFYMLGGAVVIAAVVLLLVKKRKKYTAE